MEELIDTVIENNSADVDAISGATLTSKGFLEAVKNDIIKHE
ncbi:MAG: FMN-binding protein [Treponema sp.]|nr:FMN-binding protein [Treponema sp.]